MYERKKEFMRNDELYQERIERIEKAIKFETIDRIPVIYMGSAFSPRYMGMTIAEFCEKPESATNVTLATLARLSHFGEIDGLNTAAAGRITPGLTALWLSQIAVPGRDLPPDVLWQVREQEIMTRDDYDFIVDKGWQAFLVNHLPKVIDMEEWKEFIAHNRTKRTALTDRYKEEGYVIMTGGYAVIPFEYFCGARSMGKFFLDLHRIPDRVQAAMDAAFNDIVRMCIDGTKASGFSGVWLGGWRGASSFLSPKMWNRFVWPYFKRFAYALIEAGLMPILHLDQDWTRDIEYMTELPPKKCLLNPDGMTDVRKFRELVGDRMAAMGDIPANLFAIGCPEDIRAYIRDLVKDIGPEGLLLCPGCDAPINTKPENMEAFVAASNEFGAFKR